MTCETPCIHCQTEPRERLYWCAECYAAKIREREEAYANDVIWGPLEAPGVHGPLGLRTE